MTLTIFGEITVGQEELILLADGPAEEVAWAAGMLTTLTPNFHKSDPPGALITAATWPTVVQLAHAFGERWRPSPDLSAWIDRQVDLRTYFPPTRYRPPAGLTPYPWQLEGAAMIATTGKVLITDDPGTGKTITALLGLSERWANYWSGLGPSVEPILVICPAAVIDSWVAAVKAWTPHWTVVAWRGPKRQNLLGTAHVYVTSYDTARIDAPTGRKGLLNQLAPQAVVLDECHYIKNPSAKRSVSARRICRDAPVVIPMSGTPITHNTGDLFPTLEAMEAEAWPSGERAGKRYLLTTDEGGYEEKVLGLSPYTEPEFRMCLEGQMRRIAKADVLTELPPKVYSVRTVELPPAWRKAYNEFEADMIASLPDGDELEVMSILSVIRHLQTMACSPADVRYSFTEEEDKNPFSPTFGELVEKKHVHLDLKDPSWKVAEALNILEERPHQSVLIFAPSKQLIDLMGRAATKAGRRVGYVVGGQSHTERTWNVDAFQRGDLDVICATTSAGGVGITLTAASTEIFLQRPQSLVESIQSEDRAHRIGSEVHESIEIIDIVAAGTIDTRTRELLRTHAGQLAELVRDPRIVDQLLGGPRPARTKAA